MSSFNALKNFTKQLKTMATIRESLHLKLGDAQPPLKKSLLRLYNMRFCPYAQRAVLVLDAKNIPYETVNCNLTTKPTWLFEKSEGGKVPAIEFEDGKTLSESLIIADYLNEAYPEPPLYPADPLAKAFDRRLIDAFNGDVIRAFYRIVMREDGRTEANFEELLQKVDVFEKELSKRGSKFFGGASPTMLDFMIWPWFERFPVLALMGGKMFEIPPNRFPVLMKWKDAMFADPVVKLSALPPAAHGAFLEHRKNGNYDFDLSRL